MANFVNKITKIQYDSVRDFVAHYIEEIENGLVINIFAGWEITGKLLSVLAEKTVSVDIEYAIPDINGYDFEYNIGIVRTEEGLNELFIEPAYDKNGERYKDNFEYLDAGIVIGNVGEELMRKLNEECNNIVIVSF